MVKKMNKYYAFMLCSVVLASFSQIILKKSANEKHENFIREYVNICVISGYVLLMISTVTTILAYKGIEYKNGPIIESLGYILVLILSRIFYKDKISKRKILGNVLILSGIVIFYL